MTHDDAKAVAQAIARALTAEGSALGRCPMLNWLRRRKIARALVNPTRALLERFGDGAYLEARLRHGDALHVVDGNRPPGHWEKVKEAIRKRNASPVT